MFKTLKLIGEALNKNGIKWAVGGSLVLNHFNLCDTVNDIDILIEKDYQAKGNKIISNLATKLATRDKEIYLTDSFNEYRLNGINIDVISGFKIKHEEGVYEYDFSEKSIGRFVNIEGISVPLSRLSDWYVIYQLIPEKDDKVQKLEEYFLKKSPDIDAFKRALSGELPQKVRKNIEKYID